MFRQSAIFVHTSAGIARPEDLAGKRVGEFALYGHDAGVWVKGVLQDEYGVHPESMSWTVGGLDRPLAPVDYVPARHPDGVDVRSAPAGADLGTMLGAGLLPWSNDLADRDAEVLGDDPFAYGYAANRTALETFLRYHHEQGLSRRFTAKDAIVPELWET